MRTAGSESTADAKENRVAQLDGTRNIVYPAWEEGVRRTVGTGNGRGALRGD